MKFWTCSLNSLFYPIFLSIWQAPYAIDIRMGKIRLSQQPGQIRVPRSQSNANDCWSPLLFCQPLTMVNSNRREKMRIAKQIPYCQLKESGGSVHTPSFMAAGEDVTVSRAPYIIGPSNYKTKRRNCSISVFSVYLGSRLERKLNSRPHHHQQVLFKHWTYTLHKSHASL